MRTIKSKFLNVDLDLDLAPGTNLAALARALGPVIVLHEGQEEPLAVLELETGATSDLQATICGLLECVESLDTHARALWDGCTSRTFNVGIEAGIGLHSSEYRLPSATVDRLAAVDADLVITVYGAHSSAT